MEGGDPIVEPEQARGWFDDGLRMVGLAHYGPSQYAFGTASAGPITARGKELLKVMDEVGMIQDMSHLTDQSFYEALDLFQGPIFASHSNCRALVPGDRQISDDMIKRMVERDAVIGAVFDAWMLQPNWERGVTTNENVTIATVVDHIDHVCQIAGNAEPRRDRNRSRRRLRHRANAEGPRHDRRRPEASPISCAVADMPRPTSPRSCTATG